MIQRIQTVYLILAFACLVGWFFAPIGAFEWADGYLVFNALGFTGSPGTANSPVLGYWAAGIIALAAAMILFSISRFKNRGGQLVLGRFAMLAISAVIILQYFMLTVYEPVFSNPDLYRPGRSTGIGFYLTPAALVLTFLAQRAIRKDEDLIKSLDRLR